MHPDRTVADPARTVLLKPSPRRAAAEKAHALLTVIRGVGPDLGRLVVVEGSVVLGRDPLCELPLKDRGISRHHARVTREGDGGYRLEDLGSTNGTRVDGQPASAPWPLRDGQKIFLGDTVVRFSLADQWDLDFHREVAQLVSTDPLTGLGSKRSFDDALDQALACGRELGEPLALLMMDLDRIKPINDRHGHLFGAHCIREAGRLIGETIGDSGQACRFGGDEFMAFLPGQGRAAGLEAAERIRAAVESARMEKDGVPLSPTISIGVAAFPADAERVLDLTAAADRALYRAKAQGKNRVAE